MKTKIEILETELQLARQGSGAASTPSPNYGHTSSEEPEEDESVEESSSREEDPELESLHQKIRRGDTELVQMALKKNPDIEYRYGLNVLCFLSRRNADGRTMLIAAVYYQKAEIVDLLLSQNPDKFAFDKGITD